MILTDNETKVDLLNSEAVAETIVNLLRERPGHPVTVGVHGDWGAGKSSVLEMIEAKLTSQDKVLCIKFNGWRFQGFEDAKIALIEGIVTELLGKRPALTKAAATVKDIFQRIDWLKLAKAGGNLALAVHGIPAPVQIDAVVGFLKKTATNPEQIESVITEAQSLFKPSQGVNVPEEINAFRKAFDALLKDAGIEQLIVLVDDLDRCLPDTAIETLEAIRLFVFTSSTAFVIAADEAMIEYAVRKHFPDLPETTSSQTFARNYLEKLIQVPFRLPPLGEMETRIYVTLLLIGAELEENNTDFPRLINVAREKLKKPWENVAIDAATVRTALGASASKAQNALTLADQVGPTLASGTRGNPRQIKRFLNTLILRQLTAEARGFGASVNLPVLAKLMLAERFLPRFFEQIAMSAATSSIGICEELAQLEAQQDPPVEIKSARPIKKTEETEKERKLTELKSVPSNDSSLYMEWASSKDIQAWATIDPKLANIDLRPYLFVTKDRKDYFGAATALGHLSTIADQLFGPKLAVQGMGDALKRLTALESSQLFEAVRGRIINSASFDTKPAGIDGLVILARSRPELQDTLVDFLEGLPANKLGPWVVTGWDAVITNSAPSSRLKKLMEVWEKDGGDMLKAAIAGTARLPQGRR